MFGRGRNIGIWAAIGIGAGAIIGVSSEVIGWMAVGAVVGAIIGAVKPKPRS